MTQLGISVGWSHREDIDRMVSLVQRAESVGIDACWVIDSQVAMRDPFTLLAVLARETNRIHLGPGVTNLVTRHETVVATALASLASMVPDRVLAGVGVGDSAVYPIGLRPHRLSDFEGALLRLGALLRDEEVVFGDKVIRLASATHPVPPLFVAASQPRMLALAGRVGDGVIVMGPSNAAVYRSQIEQIRRSAARAGRDPREVFVDLWVTMAVGEGALDAVRSWASTQARWLDRWARLPEALERFRTEMQNAASAYDFQDHLSVAAGHANKVSDDFAAELAVAGAPDHCRERLGEIAALDADRVTVSLMSGGREQRLEDLVSVWEGIPDG